MPKVLFSLAFVLALQPSSAGVRNKSFLPYRDVSLPVERRVDDLLSRMTLQEKILQLNQYTLGDNTNENNIGEAKNMSAGIGSVIYFDQDAVLRNSLQKRAVEETRLGIPFFSALM